MFPHDTYLKTSQEEAFQYMLYPVSNYPEWFQQDGARRLQIILPQTGLNDEEDMLSPYIAPFGFLFVGTPESLSALCQNSEHFPH